MKDSTRLTVLSRSHGRCEAVWFSHGEWDYRCHNAADDVHHAVLRSRGGALLDDVTVLHLFHLCRPCHHEVHTHPARAYANRLLISGYVMTEHGKPVYRGPDRYLSESFGPNPTLKPLI